MRTPTKPNRFEKLQEAARVKFKNISFAKQAFIHRSYLNEHKDFKGNSNERLEFLGDAVLSLVVSGHLFENLPKYTEGQLTQLRAALVRTETLAKLAQNLKLGEYLYLSKGEEDSGGRTSRTILANTFEAFVGAIFLDQGQETVTRFIKKTILDKWQTLARESVSDNKSRLQEILQRRFHKSPTYKVLSFWGPDHNRRFEVGVFLNEGQLGKGQGKNKQTAAQNAARDALARLTSTKRERVEAG